MVLRKTAPNLVYDQSPVSQNPPEATSIDYPDLDNEDEAPHRSASEFAGPIHRPSSQAAARLTAESLFRIPAPLPVGGRLLAPSESQPFPVFFSRYTEPGNEYICH